MGTAITYRGESIWSTGEGIGWSFIAGSKPYRTMIETPAVGNGKWIKKKGQDETVHRLNLHWETNDMSSVKSSIESYLDGELGSLVVPDWDDPFENCMLTNVGQWISDRSGKGNGYYILSTTLDFTEFPAGTNSSAC